MGSAISIPKALSNANDARIKRKLTNELATPLSVAIRKKKWILVTSMLDTCDETWLYQANIQKKMPLQTAIKLQAPHQVLTKLVRRCARIQIPRTMTPNLSVNSTAFIADGTAALLLDPTINPSNSKDPIDPAPAMAPPPLHPSTTSTPPTPPTPSNNPLLPPPPKLPPLADSTPITFQYQSHQLGLLQLLTTTIKKESSSLTLIAIVLNERAKIEKKKNKDDRRLEPKNCQKKQQIETINQQANEEQSKQSQKTKGSATNHPSIVTDVRYNPNQPLVG